MVSRPFMMDVESVAEMTSHFESRLISAESSSVASAPAVASPSCWQFRDPLSAIRASSQARFGGHRGDAEEHHIALRPVHEREYVQWSEECSQ